MENGAIVQTKFKSIQELEEASRWWDLDWVQLEGGEPDVDLVVAMGEGFRFYQSIVTKSYLIEGTNLQDYWSFTLLGELGLDRKVSGVRQQDNSMLVLPGLGETESLTGGRSNYFVASIHEERLPELLEAIQCPLTPNDLMNIDFINLHPEVAANLRTALHTARTIAMTSGNTQQIQANLEALLLMSLTSLCKKERMPTPSRRRRAVEIACEYIRENARSPIHLADLCRVAKVSGRTLQYAFQEFRGLSPKAYVMAYRMRHVHRELRYGESRSVTDAATRWGFWHMGQFGRDYKRLFGELPSNTLKRNMH